MSIKVTGRRQAVWWCNAGGLGYLEVGLDWPCNSPYWDMQNFMNAKHCVKYCTVPYSELRDVKFLRHSFKIHNPQVSLKSVQALFR
jgi:hypothetical protein